jgi:hypothetical protein
LSEDNARWVNITKIEATENNQDHKFEHVPTYRTLVEGNPGEEVVATMKVTPEEYEKLNDPSLHPRVLEVEEAFEAQALPVEDVEATRGEFGTGERYDGAFPYKEEILCHDAAEIPYLSARGKARAGCL